MFRILVLSAIGLAALWCVQTYLNLRKNIAIAKQTGIKYVVTPIYTYNILWLLCNRLCIPLLSKLPKSWTESWLPFLEPEWGYLYGHLPFEKYKTDLILVVSPQKNHLFVASAASATQIVTQRAAFPKPIEIYKDIDLYGKNVVSLEGSAWRAHRKITAPTFSEKNNELVWQESIAQAKELVECWGIGDHVPNPAAGTMTLALHVISRAGFGVKVKWPHEEARQKEDAEKGPMSRFETNRPLAGHLMSYKEAIGSLLDNIIWIPILPKWFLPRSPVKAHKVAFTAWKEWGQYMKELCTEKKKQISAGESTGGMDLFGALLRGAASGQPNGSSKSGGQLLTDSEILGNAFVFFLAGHETTANLLHFALVLLALRPSSQRKLHASIDAILGSKPDPTEWTYDEDFPKLFGDMPAAVMNETLRVVPAVVGIPKCTEPGRPQRLNYEGGEVTVPGRCSISLQVPALHQNPKYWPPVADENGRVDPNDLKKFKPERWTVDSSKPAHDSASQHQDSDQEAADLEGPSGPDTSASLWHPPKGAYMPFSDGYRSCLGRRFAQVEAVAVLSYLFKYYSVELSVTEWASDEELETMSKVEKKDAWDKAKQKAADLFHTGMGSVITLQMRAGKVPIRLVHRGKERFWWSQDEEGDGIDFVNPL